MQVLKTVRQAGEFGISTGEVSFDWRAVLKRKERILNAHIGDKKRSLEERSIDYFHQGVRFLIRIKLRDENERRK